MRFSDLYSRLLLTLIAGCLLYIAGTLRTLVQQADTYAALAAVRPAAVPVSWNTMQTRPSSEPLHVFIAGVSTPGKNGKWNDRALSTRPEVGADVPRVPVTTK